MPELDLLHISRYKLDTFLRCQRRFQLRFVTELPWPSAPHDAQLEAVLERGKAFHRLLEQHFLGLPVVLPPDADDEMRGWWATFRQRPPALPGGRRFPELALTVPVGEMVLFGRFDLLILGDDGAHLFDWKTERRPRSADTLRDDWQTRLYLAMLAEGAAALGRALPPEQIALTYWFVRAPEHAVTIRYDADWHRRNWAEISATIGRIARRLVAPHAVWPLTDDWDECRACAYRAYCGREVTPVKRPESDAVLESEDEPTTVTLEPDLP